MKAAVSRTSESHPIYVDFLKEHLKTLGMTFAPGKQQAYSQTGGWHRDVQKDVAELKEKYKASHLISLMELPEYSRVNISNLFEVCKENSIEVIHFPIRDGNPPEDMEAFHSLVLKVYNLCTDGNVVIIHCMGGLGRTGTLAAGCLCKAGLPAKEAITVTRRSRKGAIETPRQVAFIEEYAKRFVRDTHAT